MFAPKQLKNLLNTLESNTTLEETKISIKSRLYNCTAEANRNFNNGKDFKMHTCSDSIFARCPLNSGFIREGIKYSDEWLYPNFNITEDLNSLDSSALRAFDNDILGRNVPPLFHLWESLIDRNRTIRVFLIGGSGAHGAETKGCYCNPLVDEKCGVFNHPLFPDARKGEKYECRWTTFFIRWLRSISHATIDFVDLTFGGSTPYLLTLDLLTNLRHLFPFTRNDLIFVDYSMNEALTYFHTNDVLTQERELERMIRVFRNSSGDAFGPAVILTATWPFSTNQYRDPALPGDPNKGVDYIHPYYKLAKHYQLPLWSIRDIIWSDLFRKTREEMIPHLTPDQSHPLWHQHLFYADVIGTLFQIELHRAYEFHSLLMKLQKTKNEIFQITKAKELPIPFVTFNATSVCDPSVSPLLELVAADIVRPSSNNPRKSTGTFHTSSQDAWQLIEDRPGKFGWIDEIISSENRHGRILTFEFDDPNRDLFSYNHLVIIQYMRTYQNAGMFYVQMCGRSMESSSRSNNWDTLWPDYQDRKISTIEVHLPSTDPEVCRKNFNQQSTKQKLTIEHLPTECTDNNNHNSNQNEMCLIRDKEKVKIASVTICRLKG
jgi:hypothetical protein